MTARFFKNRKNRRGHRLLQQWHSLLRTDGNAEAWSDEISDCCRDGADSQHAKPAEEKVASREDRYQAADNEQGSATHGCADDECRIARHEEIRNYGDDRTGSKSDKGTCCRDPRRSQSGRI